MTSSLLQRLGIALPIIQGPHDGLGHPRPGCCRVGRRWAGHAGLRHALARRHGRSRCRRAPANRPALRHEPVCASHAQPRRSHRASGDGTPGAAVRRAGPAAPAPRAMVRGLCRPVRGAGGPAPGGRQASPSASWTPPRWPACTRPAAWWWARPPPWPRRAPGPVGADAVCASGTEAGGHRGTFLGDFTASQVGTLALVPQCVDAAGHPGDCRGRHHGRAGHCRCPGAGRTGRADGHGLSGVPVDPASAPRTGRPWPRPRHRHAAHPRFLGPPGARHCQRDDGGSGRRGRPRARLPRAKRADRRPPPHGGRAGAHQPPIAVGRARRGGRAGTASGELVAVLADEWRAASGVLLLRRDHRSGRGGSLQSGRTACPPCPTSLPTPSR